MPQTMELPSGCLLHASEDEDKNLVTEVGNNISGEEGEGARKFNDIPLPAPLSASARQRPHSRAVEKPRTPVDRAPITAYVAIAQKHHPSSRIDAFVLASRAASASFTNQANPPIGCQKERFVSHQARALCG